jgi:hypothetical protein
MSYRACGASVPVNRAPVGCRSQVVWDVDLSRSNSGHRSSARRREEGSGSASTSSSFPLEKMVEKPGSKKERRSRGVSGSSGDDSTEETEDSDAWRRRGMRITDMLGVRNDRKDGGGEVDDNVD